MCRLEEGSRADDVTAVLEENEDVVEGEEGSHRSTGGRQEG